MNSINIYASKSGVNLHPLSIKRDWMDDTHDKHAYRCFPMSLANQIGWGISFDEDLEFIWDGITSTSPENIKILQGNKFLSLNRANATISFETGLMIDTKENISLLIMPVPNQFIDGITCYTTIISTSVLKASIPCAWRITRPNIKILIPANTPVASIVPLSIKNIEEYEINIFDYLNPERDKFLRDYGDASLKLAKEHKWTNFYRDAVDHNGNVMGEHEVKKIILNTNDYRK